jgi:hypothetical protein
VIRPFLLALCILAAPSAFAALIITEVMVNPAQDDRVYEYVELYNTGPGAVDLSGMLIGVSGSFDAILPVRGGLHLWVGRYAVVVDPDCVWGDDLCYEIPDDALVVTIESSGFGRYGLPNNRSDTVVVADSRLSIVDRMAYHPEQVKTGLSLERIDYGSDGLDPNNWAASHRFGGSPGERNDASVPLPVETKMTIGPEVPADYATIELEMVAAPAHIEVRVFDREGRPVRNLIDGVRSSSRVQITWDGLDDRGNAVPTGIYVVLAEAAHVDTGKRIRVTGTAVIARRR